MIWGSAPAQQGGTGGANTGGIILEKIQCSLYRWWILRITTSVFVWKRPQHLWKFNTKVIVWNV